MKKLTLLFIVMLLPMVANADAVEIDGIYYNLVSKVKEAEVTSNPNKYSGSIVIPSSVIYEGIEYNVTSIGLEAFYRCSSLNTVIIPNSVVKIGTRAFQNSRSLTSVTVGSGVTSIGQDAFFDCIGLTSVCISDLAAWCKIIYNNSSTPLRYAHHLYIDGQEIKNLVIPNNVTSIGNDAFRGCTDLISVTIPSSVTSIGYNAFNGCSGLKSVTIPNSVTSIAGGTFFGCSGLTSVTIPNSITSIESQTFYDCSSLTSVTIPNSVTSIGKSAFRGCVGLTSINIPNCVLTIEDEAFRGCSSLTSISIPNSVTSIGKSVFQGCSLTSVIIPNSVSSIEDYAFFECSSLVSVTIGNSVSSIGWLAFGKCAEITDVYCLPEQVRDKSYSGTGLFTSPGAFENSYPEYITLHVPSASIAAYRAIEPWSKFKDIVALDPQCATPIINYVNDKISFSCATDGVEFVSEVMVSDAQKYYDSEINLAKKYIVSVYATKTGYINSDVATKEIAISGGSSEQVYSVRGDLNNDGKVDVADHVELSKIIMASGTNPGTGTDPNPVNPSGDDLETDKITASFLGGAYSSINGKIQSGSQLNVKFSNKSSKSVTLTKMQLNDAATGSEGNNMLSEEVVVAAGQDVSYTITVGILGISKPVISFTYRYNNKTYQVKGEWVEIELPNIGF